MTVTDEMTGRSGGRSVVEDLAASGGLDELFERIDSGQVELTGSDGLLPALLKETLERGLAAELTEHLGYEKGEPTAVARGNARNGTTAKTISSEVGSFEIEVPRDRAGTFTPRLVRKGQRRMDGLDAMIISLYAGGMTVREIRHHLDSTLGAELNAGTISNITDAVADAVLQWQSRPLEEFYPVIHLDAIRVKIRDQGRVSNRAAHIAVGVDMEGIKHVLGIWVQADEGASFWAHVCAELANRGVNDVLIVCCDGLTGLAEAVEATWPDSVVQTCVVHLIRSSMRFVAYQDRKRVAAALKPVYTAASEDAASSALAEFAASPLGARYPDTVGVWERAWERFTPFLAFPPALRRVIYTANSIESLNYQLRKVSKNRGHFPNDTAAVKLLWLAICNIEDKRALERERDRGKPAGKRRAKPRLVEGQTTTNWKQALAQLTTAYPDRINPYL
ncbi:transposase, mutator family [Propionibacterium acidifaciens F0233]|uniref:Mutator family transposase n=2 Tax=Propionibacterium acidifaciens TaxID=556499 RepID=U2QCM3_9ACTN|nr:transposase, mutator family [Propionibacterium acidifaciens F0233]